MPDSAATTLDALLGVPAESAAQLAAVLLGPGSTYSLVALAVTLGVAVTWTLARSRRGRAVRIAVLTRALFPRRMLRSASGRADLGLALFNIMLAPLFLGGALLAFGVVDGGVRALLTGALGGEPLLPAPWMIAAPLATLALFLAYEFGYWLTHYLSHKVGLLWQFHRVHHSAASLSFLTAFRVHPVDTMVFYNIVVVVTGVVSGTVTFLLGPSAGPLTIGGNNLLVFAGAVLLTHLHHSHLWIAFRGRLGNTLLSPAHHQIHHSSDPAHHDCNFGNCIALWDRLFGTLHAPAEKRQPLVFGVHGDERSPHSAGAMLVTPFLGAARVLLRRPADLGWSAPLPLPRAEP